MYLGRTTLSKFLIQQLTGIPGANDLGALLIDVAAAIKAISAMTAKGALGGYLGEQGGKNAQGETQQKLDVLAHEVMIRSCEWGGLLAGMVSEELEDPCAVPEEYVRGRYLLVFDPLDGSSNIDVNVAVGTIFSVLRHDSLAPPGAADYLQPGCRLVAEVHRILMRGGVFMYPKDTRDASRPGRLRLLYEANPISLLVEQAGGRATTGSQRLMEVDPLSLHQRVPLILGSRNEVERIERYHAEHLSGTDRPYVSPLFNERSLFRPEALT